MKKFTIICVVVASLILLIGIGVSLIDSMKPPDIKSEVGVLIYSSSGLDSKECYLIFVGEREKPIKAPADSIVFKFDSQLEKPVVKIWLEEKEVAEKTEIWFRDEDQLREYMR